jgi:hypothetical protein
MVVVIFKNATKKNLSVFLFILLIVCFYARTFKQRKTISPEIITKGNTSDLEHPDNFFVEKLQADQKIVIYQRSDGTRFGSVILSYLFFA